MSPGTEDRERDRQKLEILERHVDHLLGQLYHQVELIRSHKARGDHVEVQLEKVRGCPKELDEALQRIANLREEIAGRKEVELDLRRRLEILEREDKLKQRHIERLESEVKRMWNSPPRRLLRGVRDALRGMLGRRAGPKPTLEDDPLR